MKLMGIVNMPKFCEYNGVGENQFIPAFCFLKEVLLLKFHIIPWYLPFLKQSQTFQYRVLYHIYVFLSAYLIINFRDFFILYLKHSIYILAYIFLTFCRFIVFKKTNNNYRRIIMSLFRFNYK